MAHPSPVELLTSAHRTSGFECGKRELDEFLQRHALANLGAGGARTYVTHLEMRVLGYHSLAAGAVRPSMAPERVSKGMAAYDVPVVLLARLAVDRAAQGRGLGAGLLKDALVRSAAAADAVGVRAVLVHAKDDEARAFYEHFGFEPSPTDPFHLFLLMKDLRSWLGSAR